jgi:probable F420-dependent oxidoreductase
MKFSVGYPLAHNPRDDALMTAEFLAEFARVAEECGYHSVNVTEHPIPGNRFLGAGGHHAPDPFVTLAFAAGVTTSIRLLTNLTVVPYRNPFLLAKAAATLDRISNGRLVLGVGTGYLKPEFFALGVDFDERNELTDEAIDVIRLALGTDALEYEGRHFRSRGTTMRPRATGRALPPIWVGGNSRAAIRRAVERGDGWVPFPNPASAARAVRTPLLASIEDLAERIDYMHSYASETGHRVPPDICFHPFSLTDEYDRTEVLDELAILAQLGVTWCVLSAPSSNTRAEYLDAARKFASAIIDAAP